MSAAAQNNSDVIRIIADAEALATGLDTEINELINQALEFASLYGFALARAWPAAAWALADLDRWIVEQQEKHPPDEV